MGDAPAPGPNRNTARPWRNVLAGLNEGRRGPISLRSAASSMSPSLRGNSDGEEERKANGVKGNEDEDEDEDADENGDVEEIDLGDGGGGKEEGESGSEMEGEE